VETASTAIRFFIDQPTDWSGLSRCLVIRGWCFAAAGTSIRAIRLRTINLTLLGVIGLPRPDVKAALPEAPDDNTGFVIRGTLPLGSHALSLEAELPDGSWHQLLAQKVKLRGSRLPPWLGVSGVSEMIAFQLPMQMAHPPKNLRPEKFPATAQTIPLPKFSIVTPSYQQARFLGETMRSVLEQREVAGEYVVQDGGSTDGSAEIIRRAAEASEPLSTKSDPPGPDRLRMVAATSEPDEGQTDALIRGFAKTTGSPYDVMAWINSDDFYQPGALAFVAGFFARHPEVDVLYGHRVLVDEASCEIGRWFLPKHDDEVLRLYDFVPQETMFWRRRIWDTVGGLDPSFNFAMDWDLLLRFQAAGARIVRVPCFLACFRLHATQKTAVLMHADGQKEIDLLRERTHGRQLHPPDLENNPRLVRYLRKSAWLEFQWRLQIRGS
jgi:glycosyltransferase involved in cell wall biosynthesis